MLLCYVILFDHYYLTIYFLPRYNWNIIKSGVKHLILILTIYLHHVRCILWRNCFFFFLREGGSLIITLKKNLFLLQFFISLPGYVSFCITWCLIVVCCTFVHCKIFQKVFCETPLGEYLLNLVWIVERVSSFKIISGDSTNQTAWLLFL